MPEAKIKEKGIVLLVVLATIFIVILLANILVGIMVSQSRLTHHKTSRIQAHYAAMAGINYAYDALRTGSWALPALGGFDTYNLCNGCAPPGINEPNLPASVTNVAIVVAGRDYAGCDPPGNTGVCVSASAAYTYTP